MKKEMLQASKQAGGEFAYKHLTYVLLQRPQQQQQNKRSREFAQLVSSNKLES